LNLHVVHLLVAQDRSLEDFVEARVQVRQDFVRVQVLDRLVQLQDQHLLLDDDVLAADLLQRHQHQQVRVHEHLTHLEEERKHGAGRIRILQVDCVRLLIVVEDALRRQELDSLLEGLLVELVDQNVLAAENVREHHALRVALLGAQGVRAALHLEVVPDKVRETLLKHED